MACAGGYAVMIYELMALWESLLGFGVWFVSGLWKVLFGRFRTDSWGELFGFIRRWSVCSLFAFWLCWL